SDLSSYNLLQRCAAGDKDFHDADLSDRNLSGFDLSSANLTHADLSGADLRRANLAGADLRFSNLRGTKLRDANLTGARLHEATCDRDTNFGPKFDLDAAGYTLQDDGNGTQQILAKLSKERLPVTAASRSTPIPPHLQTPAVSAPAAPPSPASPSSNPHSPHLTPDFIAACQAELANIVGPMANLICQQTLEQYPRIQPEEFVKLLSQHIPQPETSEAFLQQFL
ncbi:MAG: pentapeptide repeat-containing protein, partial [Cyanobacteria bacterium J06639_1]